MVFQQQNIVRKVKRWSQIDKYMELFVTLPKQPIQIIPNWTQIRIEFVIYTSKSNFPIDAIEIDVFMQKRTAHSLVSTLFQLANGINVRSAWYWYYVLNNNWNPVSIHTNTICGERTLTLCFFVA